MISFSFSRIRCYSAIAFFVAVAIAIFSGWQDVAMDRSSYLQMYQGVISTEEWAIKLWFAKDVFFLVVAEVSNYFSEDAKLAFLMICTFSILLKYFSIRKMGPEYTLGFVMLYGIFLAPGLEFAAMRGGLAIGFVMLALACREQKIKFFVLSALAIASHMSALLVVVLTARQVNKFLSEHKWGYALIALVISLSAGLLLNLFPHGADYENNRGTVIAFSEPLATLIIARLIFFRLDRFSKLNVSDTVFQHLQVFRPVVYGLIAIAFGITSVVVTAATRYLEISWCLMLFASIVMFRKSYINMLGGLLLLSFLTYLNIIRFTWLAIVNPTLGS
jgi:hypothetical protein